ncbi:hypothetical protein Tco_1249835 [Tanacetum coccineum]
MKKTRILTRLYGVTLRQCYVVTYSRQDTSPKQDYGVTALKVYAVTSLLWKAKTSESALRRNEDNELRTDDEDAHEHVRRVLEIIDLFHFPGVTHDAIMLRVFPITLKGWALRCPQHDLNGQQKVHIFYTGLEISTRRMLDSKGFITLMKPNPPLISIQVMADHSHNWKKLINSQTVLTNIGKERTTMGKENMKEPVPHNLPPTPFLGHLKEQMGSPCRARETVCMIGNPEEVHIMKAQENEGDMDVIVQPYMPLGPVHDTEKIVRKEEQDYNVPLHDGVMQPLTPQTTHITPPDDDYVAPTINPTLDKQLNEFEEECFDITRVADKANGNPVKDVPAARRQISRPSRPVIVWLVAYAKCNRDAYESELGENELAQDEDFSTGLLYSEAMFKGVYCPNSTLHV